MEKGNEAAHGNNEAANLQITVSSNATRLDCDEIIDNLFVGSLVAANKLCSPTGAQEALNLDRILSIGCSIDAVEESHSAVLNIMSYPTMLDLPSVPLFPHLNEWVQFIDEGIRAQEKVLVHCVHGQSRSASTVIAYLILKQNFSVEEACVLLKRQRPNICINPGFLCQLCCISSCISFPELFNCLQSAPSSRKAIRNVSEIEGQPIGEIRCKACSHPLSFSTSVLPHVDCATVLEEHCDEFWNGYKPFHPKSSVAISSSSLQAKALVAMAPEEWMVNQAVSLGVKKRVLDGGISSKGKKRQLLDSAKRKQQVECNEELPAPDALLSCPRCKGQVGIYLKQGLLICGDYLTVDLYGLLNDCVS